MSEEGLVTRPRYPLGVVVVMFIAALRCLTIAAVFIGVQNQNRLLDWLIGASPVPDEPAGSSVALIGQAILIGVLIASLLTILGLLGHRRWAWVLAIVTSGFILALDLGWWFDGEARYGSMLLNVVAVFYLNQPDVRISLGGGRSLR